ncbi:MAG TPA: heme lyase CcmF/NrfE family subunit [Caulobacteraceae bacterium]|jgi:cytochrome c-type biogenesis protein CcmF|nr:heme lyase CcmF/NrfE family subunit [Caulobacteraceae bacterium]
MTAEIGQLALILALLLSIVQAVSLLVGAARGDGALMGLGRMASGLQLGFVALAFGALMACYLGNDFSVALVAQHSNTAQPLIYRFGATWGSHEGSMLLWVLILALYGGAVAAFGGALRESLQARVLGVQGVVGAAFLGFLLFTSNPFLRLSPAPTEGAELNPVLQDPGLVFHPPVLYLGYVGLSIAFAFAVAALIEGRVEADWGRWVRPWVLAAWIFLTLGITMGSVWSYYTLGWGGWWAWDPVENASFMPWLLATALLHSSLVLERRGALVSWTILLAILTFSMSLVGTFLVRSGVLTSVHSFALDAKRGVYVLGIIGVLSGAALALFAWRAPALKTGALFSPVSREFGILLNNLILSAATATVFLGTFYPVFVDALHGDKISIGAPYFNIVFAPLFMLLFVLVSFGPTLSWKRDALGPALRRLVVPACGALAALVLVMIVFGVRHVMAAIGAGLAVWLVLGAGLVLARRWRLGERGPERGAAALARRVRATPLAVWGLVLAHAGLGVTALGITAMAGWQSDRVVSMAPGASVVLAGRSVRLMAVREVTGPNYEAVEAVFRVPTLAGVRTLTSERRLYPASGTTTTGAGINVGLLGNTYVSLGDRSPDGGLVVRMWNQPLVDFIWGGAFMMAAGGMLSLADRRLRVAAVRRRPLRALSPAAAGA